MSQVEQIIRTMGAEGASAATIATELNNRGLHDHRRRPFGPSTIEGFLRIFGVGLTSAYTPLAADSPASMGVQETKTPAAPPEPPSKGWNFESDNLNVRD